MAATDAVIATLPASIAAAAVLDEITDVILWNPVLSEMVKAKRWRG
jgi:hypothetical protein